MATKRKAKKKAKKKTKAAPKRKAVKAVSLKLPMVVLPCPSDFCARANLGELCHELGKNPGSAILFRGPGDKICYCICPGG